MLSDGKFSGEIRLNPEGGRRLVEILFSIYKKWDRRNCSNYCEILILSIQGKAFGCVLYNRLSTLAEGFPSEPQCGFRANRRTTNIIYLRQIQEECIEQNMPLNMIFVDFTKAWDTVNREALWNILWCPGYFVPSWYTRIKDIRQLKRSTLRTI